MGLENMAQGAVGQGLGLILGGVQDNRQAKQTERLQKIQISGQKEMTDYNQSKALEMWDKTNYEAQMKHLKNAGLNAGLIYGGSGGGGATAGVSGGSVQGATAGDPNTGQAMGIQQAAQLALMGAQKENIEADTANKKAEATYTGGAKTEHTTQDKNLKMAQESNIMWDNEVKEVLADVANKTKPEAIKTVGAILNKIIAETKNTTADTIKIGNEIQQKWAQVAQGWEGLSQQQQKINIDKFKEEIKANYPSIWNAGGKAVNDFMDALNHAVGATDYKKHEVGGKP